MKSYSVGHLVGTKRCCHHVGYIKTSSDVGYLTNFPCLLQFPRDEDGEPLFDELICKSCVPQCQFLSNYPDLIIAPSAVPDVSTDPAEIVDQMDGSGIYCWQKQCLLLSDLHPFEHCSK